MNKAIVCLCLLFVPWTARAESGVIFYQPVPTNLVSWVERQMGGLLPRGEKIAVIENDAPMLVAVHQGILRAPGAAYAHGQIYFPVRTIVRFQDAEVQALTIHELTHAAQDSSHHRYHCDGEREAEAYRLQNTWLIEQGLPPVIDDTTLNDLTSCGKI